jgi:hypothetical protein
LLKARRPEKFKDRVANEHSGEKEVTVRWESEPSDLDRARAAASLFAKVKHDAPDGSTQPLTYDDLTTRVSSNRSFNSERCCEFMSCALHNARLAAWAPSAMMRTASSRGM